MYKKNYLFGGIKYKTHPSTESIYLSICISIEEKQRNKEGFVKRQLQVSFHFKNKLNYVNLTSFTDNTSLLQYIDVIPRYNCSWMSA